MITLPLIPRGDQDHALLVPYPFASPDDRVADFQAEGIISRIRSAPT